MSLRPNQSSRGHDAGTHSAAKAAQAPVMTSAAAGAAQQGPHVSGGQASAGKEQPPGSSGSSSGGAIPSNRKRESFAPGGGVYAQGTKASLGRRARYLDSSADREGWEQA